MPGEKLRSAIWMRSSLSLGGISVLRNDPRVRIAAQAKKRRVPFISDQDVALCACDDDGDKGCGEPSAICAVNDKPVNFKKRLRDPRCQGPR